MKNLIFIHGNSCSGAAFAKKLSWLKRLFNVIFVDLPGHGNSSDFKNPTEYSFKGYAKWVLELMDDKNIKSGFICGWSLGGHVAIEIANLRREFVLGLILTGTPPIELTPKGFIEGFLPLTKIFSNSCKSLSEMMGQKDQFTIDEAKTFITAAGLPLTNQFINDAIRTDGNARFYMINSCISGDGGIDEKKFMQETDIPTIFIAGKRDMGINFKYITSLKYKNCHGIYKIKGGHACFWDSPVDFTRILIDFCDKV